MLHPLVAQTVNEADIILFVPHTCDPAKCCSRLVEEEVRRNEAEGECLVIVLDKIGA